MARSRLLNTVVGKLLATSHSPVFVLDSQRCIVYGNAAFFQWAGDPGQELIGVQCDYHSSPEFGVLREMAAKLCPPAEVFAGQLVTAEISGGRPGDRISRRNASFLPIGSDDDEIVAVIAAVDGEEVPSADTSADRLNSITTDLHQRLRTLRDQAVLRFGIDRLIGDSLSIRRIRDQVRFAHRSRVHSVIHGPVGSGREHTARTIHYGDAPASAARLVPVACPLMDAELIQATITNVIRNPVDQGPATLLLLDVDQLPETAQYELSGFFDLPGFDLATLSTARSDLIQLASDGKFRKDLAARLSTLVIHLPGLSERREDIPPLAQVFLEQFNSTGGRQLSGFSPEALDQLAAYAWPGNVDELAETVHEACASAEGTIVNAWDLPQRLRYAADAEAFPREEDERIVLDDFLAEIEAELIHRALQRAKGNKTKAAALLGVTRARLHRRIDQMMEGSPTGNGEG